MSSNTGTRVAAKLKGQAASLGRRMDLMAGVTRLTKRVNELEREMQEQRELSLRVAQLTDIVQELLIPIADRDEEKLHRLLQEYSATL
jgi:hypothetical protein